MKKALFIAFSLVLMGACNQQEASDLQSDLTEESSTSTTVDEKETKAIAERNPEMVFNPEEIKVGDTVGNMVLEKITVNPEIEGYPHVTYEATFSGSILAEGVLKRFSENDELLPNAIVFTPNLESSKLFPVGNEDERYVWLVISNGNDVLRDVELNNGEEKSVKIELEGYVIRYLPTDAANASIYDGLLE